MAKIIRLVEEHQMCSLPWVHAEIDLQNNSIKPCCKYLENLGNVSEGFTNVWMNQHTQQLRQDWISNITPTACSSCVVSDDAFSYKKWKNQLYTDNFDFLSTTESDAASTPSVFHFSLSNTCNLACRMCDSTNSSKLAQMARKHTSLQKYLAVIPPTKAINPETLRGSFKNAELITFAGGEPLIDDDTITVIKMIKEESTNLKLVNFSTNLTIINDALLSELNSMKGTVSLSISIDGPVHIHEYIRYHCSWNKMMDNLAYIRKNYPRIVFAVNSTISVLNVGYVTEFLELLDKIQDAGVVITGLMTSPVLNKKFLHPGILPQEIKDMYIDKIKSYQGSASIRNSNFLLPTAIELLSKDVVGEIDGFVDYITEFDKVAGTSVVDVYPEFQSIFK